MKKWAVIVVVVGLFGWALYDLLYEPEEKAEKKAGDTVMTAEGPDGQEDATSFEKGEQAPDFTLQTLGGEEVSLSDYRGTPVIINFWATWCPPCRAEMPDMEEMYQKEDDLKILAVNMTETESSRNAVSQFVGEFNLSFPILLDRNTDVSGLYEVGPVPTSVFVDREGKVQSVILGAMNKDLMKQRLEEME
ncbi:redoxin domain-containing protein [Salimicrobium halophilum]|uniref:Peroxiredoxin n=1 Tax=Salimicrobium halophilum TaxID=86666 RepID=A0A1G8T026_9BACI|nr:redoxin domain-containing protein [Salimicrobium halophilum]SDJ34130.1 Peroxiredoxin [Salimicrobium halophilum]